MILGCFLNGLRTMVLKANPDKFNLVLNETGNDISISNSRKLLGVKIDNKLTFEHVTDLCCKASQKLHALAQQRHTIMKAVISSQFGYCL